MRGSTSLAFLHLIITLVEDAKDSEMQFHRIELVRIYHHKRAKKEEER